MENDKPTADKPAAPQPTGAGDRDGAPSRTERAREAPRAEHGPPSEVSWDGGRGHQPYENQDAQADTAPGAEEFPEGNRGPASGVNIDALEQVREKWRDSP